MKIFTRVTTASFVALAVALTVSAQGVSEKITNKNASLKASPKLVLSPCFIGGIKGSVKCGSIDVPLDYEKPDGTAIPVHVVVLPATSANPAKDPLLIFAGGPGQAAGDYGPFVRLAFFEVHKDRDILLIDQRGTGKSYGLNCPSEGLEDVTTKPKVFAEKCRAKFDIDVRYFTLENIMRDTDTVRAQLGYETVNVWGGSYGTKSASLYLKRYPERVRSIIVDGVLPPDSSLFLSAPASAERALGKLVDDCKAQPSCNVAFPNFKAQVNDLIARAADGELAFKGIDPVSNEYVEFDLEREMIVESIRSVMYGAQGTTILPYAVNEAHKGNLAPLLAPLLSSAATPSSMYLGSTFSLLCGEDVASIDAEAAKRAGEGSFAQDSYYTIWSNYCEGWDYFRPKAADFFAPATGDVPALILSGDLDPVTPPPLGEHWLKGFPNGRHIIVAGTGHNTSQSGCMPQLIDEFIDTLDAASLDTSCLDYLKRLPLVVGPNGNVE